MFDSIYIHPFECQELAEKITAFYDTLQLDTTRVTTDKFFGRGSAWGAAVMHTASASPDPYINADVLPSFAFAEYAKMHLGKKIHHMYYIYIDYNLYF